MVENRDNINQLVKDLEFIKAAVKRNHPVFQQWAAATPMKLLMAYYGTGTIIVALLFQFSIGQYGSFTAIPGTVKVLLFAFLAVIGISATFLKWATMNRSARRIDRGLGMWSLLWKYYMYRGIHVYAPLTVLTFGLIVYFAFHGPSRLIIGVVGLYVGVLMNIFAIAVSLFEYYVFGYWMLAAGVLSFLLPGVAGGIWIAVYGAGCFAFIAATAVRAGREEPELPRAVRRDAVRRDAAQRDAARRPSGRTRG